MLSRRSLLIGVGLAFVLRPNPSEADVSKTLIEWLSKAIDLAVPSLEDIFNYLLQAEYNAGLLISSERLLQDIRRRISDAGLERDLSNRLGDWLTRYDSWVNETPRAAESNEDFSARRERERLILVSAWEGVKGDTTEALLEIRELGEKINNIDSLAISTAEWHQYRELLNEEKLVAAFLNTEMPTDSTSIEGLKGISKKLSNIVATIDRLNPQLVRKIESGN
jgi:hypothetical protein